MTALRRDERFSGHESFVCRYGWLPKVYRAVSAEPQIFRSDDLATRTLGIGRNMVRSVQFWAEATGVIAPKIDGANGAGPLGPLLLGKRGWDPHLENLESLWLLHWWMTTRANVAAWNAVFGEATLGRFEKRHLVETLAFRGGLSSRTLAASTLEQHASIFCQTRSPSTV